MGDVERMGGGKKVTIGKQIWSIKKTILVIFIPLFLLPIPVMWNEKQGKCAYVILIMILFWMTEVLPMAVTALIPIVMFPWLGVMHSKEICINYLKDANMLFFGGLLIAIAVEKWNLHKRVALRILMLVGSKPKWILFGFMMVTCFLSMWLSNTATTAMMMPISQAVLTELDENRIKNLKKPDGSPLPAEEIRISDATFKKFKTALKICIPFACNIGGIGTLIGTGPNIVLKGQLDILYSKSLVNFTNWLLLGVPIMVVDILMAWFLILCLFVGFKKCFGSEKQKVDNTANDVIKTEYVKLGKMTFAEKLVGLSFLTLAFLWISREPEFVPGWGSLMDHEGMKYVKARGPGNSTIITPKPFKTSFVTDASVAITVVVLLFIFPSKFPNYLFFRKKTATDIPGPAPPLLDWPTANRQMPWSVILLLGGGFALADACKVSKLSVTIGQVLVTIKVLPAFVISLIMTLVTLIFTQFTSNVAVTTIMIPIIEQVSQETCINPGYLMIPVALAASFAFCLPVGTPPNAIAYSYGDISSTDMMKCGLLMCIVTLMTTVVAINTWCYSYFELHEWPDWAPKGQC